jgi:hypothetical protein
MRASKEKAIEAKQAFDRVIARLSRANGVPVEDCLQNEASRIVVEFLEAAERKLPSEAAYKRDRTRARARRS